MYVCVNKNKAKLVKDKIKYSSIANRRRRAMRCDTRRQYTTTTTIALLSQALINPKSSRALHSISFARLPIVRHKIEFCARAPWRAQLEHNLLGETRYSNRFLLLETMKSHSAAPAVLQCCAVIRADAMMRELLLVLSYNVTDAFGSSSIFRAIISSAVELAFSRRRRSRNSSHCFESGARRTRSLCPCTPLDHAHTKSMVLSIGVQALPRNPHAFFRHEFFKSLCVFRSLTATAPFPL